MGGSPTAGVGGGATAGVGGGAAAGVGAGSPARNTTRGSLLAERVEVAAGLWARFLGLMGRPSLPAGSGLWLDGTNGIHMFFMRFPIDCVFLDRPAADGGRRVVAVFRELRPWTGIVWYVRRGHGALELPVGAIAASGTQVGDVVRLG